MIVKSIDQVEAFLAGDHTLIREILHPKNDALALTYSLAHATLPVGEASLPHRLRESSEVYVILSGQGRVHIDDHVADLKPGDLVVIPAGARQFIVNTGDSLLCFLCIVSPPWRKENDDVDDN